jgi:hypothetical protein
LGRVIVESFCDDSLSINVKLVNADQCENIQTAEEIHRDLTAPLSFDVTASKGVKTVSTFSYS